MSTVTENDLQRLEDLINKRFDSLESEQKEIKKDLTEIKINIATLKEGQNSLNKRLDDNQSSINKRLDDNQSSINKRIDNLDFIARTIIASVAVALLVGLAKILYPNLIS